MIVGILSDTHGRAEVTAAALALLQRCGAAAFIHCGDVGGESVLDEFAGRRAWFVWGNSDDPGQRLQNYARRLELPLPAAVPLRLELAGTRLAVFHGHESEFERLRRLAEADELGPFTARAAADYVLFGHSHTALDLRVGGVRLINPGALHRADPRSVATLDLARDELKFWRVERDGAAAAGQPPVQFTPAP